MSVRKLSGKLICKKSSIKRANQMLFDDKEKTCTSCGGTGRVTMKKRCSWCSGSGRNLSCYAVPDRLEEFHEDQLGYRRFPCKACDGKKWIEEKIICGICFGTGKKRY